MPQQSNQTCVDNLIGAFRACHPADSPAPRSGLFIDDLPGLSLANVSQGASSKLPTAAVMAEAKITYAAKLIEAELLVKMSAFGNPAYNLVTDTLEVGYPLNDTTSLGSGTAAVRFERCGTMGLRDLRILTLVLHPLGDGDITVTVTDGVESETQTVTAVSGIALPVYSTFTTQRDHIDVQIATAVPMRQMRLWDNTLANKCDCSCGHVQCGNITAKGLLNGSWNVYTHGIQVRAAIVCNPAKALCLIPDNQLGVLMQYRAAIELLREATYNAEALNYFTEHAKLPVLLKELVAYYDQFWATVLPAVSNALIQADNTCFDCGQPRFTYG